MPLRTYVEIGRVAYLTQGKQRGKLCTIVNVVDQNRAVVDGPSTGVPRQAVPLKHLRLTRQKLRIPHSTSTKVVRRAWEKEGVTAKWKESAFAKKLAARKLKANMSDFDRFKLKRTKQAMNRLVRVRFLKLKALAKKSAKKAHEEKLAKKKK
ncbi:60S ribosomal protein L14 [Ixodes scapularis]|uniref:Large ribosomal subunit protein eL14 n=2 Tax=Ixodes TaxID=6944 RepID=Q4PM06_IXOSC|nr:60S ribosomal protein L14 [Ixodes scapularis]AAY66959.1 60S ribosomal protein L14 [Ixodes scapularis]